MITGDDTKLNMKDEDHGLYPQIGNFCHVRSTGLLVWMCALLQRGVSIVTLELEGGV